MPARTASRNTASAALYEEDFLLWTERTAGLLRAGRFDEIDIEHVAEEIHDMGVSQRREAVSRLRVLLTHLIQWKVQPDRRSRSWSNTIETQRDELLLLLQQMPSVRHALQEQLEAAYGYASRKALKQTGLLNNPLSEKCPFTLSQILDIEFLPD